MPMTVHADARCWYVSWTARIGVRRPRFEARVAWGAISKRARVVRPDMDVRDLHFGRSTRRQSAQADPFGVSLAVVAHCQIPVAVAAVTTLGKLRRPFESACPVIKPSHRRNCGPSCAARMFAVLCVFRAHGAVADEHLANPVFGDPSLFPAWAAEIKHCTQCWIPRGGHGFAFQNREPAVRR